jgi:hypothetical protein
MTSRLVDGSEGFLLVWEVAELYKVDRHTVITWARNWVAENGKTEIPAIRTPGGEWRISKKFVREHRGL